MTGRKCFCLVLVLAFLGIAACGGEEKKNEVETLFLGHSERESNLLHVTLRRFAKAVEERSGGKLKILIFPAEQLGNNLEMAQMVERNTLDCMVLPAGQQASMCPKFETLSLPFLFLSYPHVYRVLDSAIGQELLEGLTEHNMMQLAYWENGLRQITNDTVRISSPEDLRGLLFCISQNALTKRIFEAFGAKAWPYELSKRYLVLKKGLFDGQETSVANIYAARLQEVQKYLSIVNYQYQPRTLVISLERWHSLPSDLQTILHQAAKEFGHEHRRSITRSEGQMLIELDGYGMEINYPDPANFEGAVQGIYRKFYADNPWARDLVRRIRALR